jgi:probable O-glycosylation ligase (exosortase A-associated)
MRDILVTLICLGALPLAFKKPFVGLLFFSALAYMRLQDLAWGFARDMRWSFYVAIVTFAGYLMSKDKRPPMLNGRTLIMVLLVVVVGIGHLFLAEGREAADVSRFADYVKIIGVAIFTTAVVRTREQLRILIWVIAMCFAFYGVKAGVAGIVKLGDVYIKRGPGGMIEDNNDFALALAMSIPLLLHLGTSEKRAILSKGVMLMIPLTMIAVVLTRSRGGTLAMAFCMAILVWRSQRRLVGMTLVGLSAIAVLALAPKEYKERIYSIKDYQSEGSAASRLRAWAIAMRMVQANPVWGVGFGRFQQNYADYDPHPTPEVLAGEGVIVAHNSYLQIWAECGSIAFGLYLLLIGLSFWDIWTIRKQARRRYHSSWILSYCTMFEAALGTFVLGSVFLNRAHFDLIYHYVAIVMVFGHVARQEMENESRYPTRSRAGHRGELTLSPARGFGRTPGGSVRFRAPLIPQRGN